MAFQLDRDRQRSFFGVVEELLRRALRERREADQFLDQRVGRGLELVVGDDFGGDAPLIGLPRRNAPRPHHDILGAGDADDLLQAGRTAGPRNLPELLFRQRILAGLGDETKIARQRNLEPDAEAIAAIGDDDRLGAARRRRDVPRQLGHMLRRGFHKTLDVAAGGKMLADRAQHDHAHALVLVQRLEHQAELIALRHFDDVERRPVEDDVGALLGDVQFDLEAVERRQTRIV